jgi:hypothetical protein
MSQIRAFLQGDKLSISTPSVECWLQIKPDCLLQLFARNTIIIPMKLSRLQALGWEIRIILIKLSRLQALGWERL